MPKELSPTSNMGVMMEQMANTIAILKNPHMHVLGYDQMSPQEKAKLQIQLNETIAEYERVQALVINS